MSTEGKKYAVAVVCADGRLHNGASHFNQSIAQHLEVDLVDELSLAGPDGVTKPGREKEAEVLAKNLQMLIGAHKPVSIAFVAHYNCAGNPVQNDEHDKDIVVTATKVKEMLQFDGKIKALVATYSSDTQWPLKEVATI